MAYPKSPLAKVNGLFVCFANGRTEQGVQIYGILRERVTTGRLYNPNPTSTLAIEASANYSSVGSVRLTSYDLKLIRWGQPTKGIERCRGGLKATHSKGGCEKDF